MILAYKNYTPLKSIDTTALEAAVLSLCRFICTMDIFVNNGRDVLRASRQLGRAAGRLLKADTHNKRVRLKLEMLLSPRWRARVLLDLGGERALERWERRMGCLPKRKNILTPHASIAQRRARGANLERAREALRQQREDKARRHDPRHHFNDSHPHIAFDRVKVDGEGQFRLAPMTRGQVRLIKTLHKRDPVPEQTEAHETGKTRIRSVQYIKASPIPVWPCEFRAAEQLRDGTGGETKSAVSPHVIPAPAAITPHKGVARHCKAPAPHKARAQRHKQDDGDEGLTEGDYIKGPD